MIYLHAGTGSSEIDMLDAHFTPDRWTKVRASVQRLLTVRQKEKALSLWETLPFELYNGTNPFGDQFTVLHATVPLDQYTHLVEESVKHEVKRAASALAYTVGEVGPKVRFVVVELDTEESVAPVATPSLEIQSDAVVRALEDAADLIRGKGGPISAVDRVHTALQGYLRAACQKNGVTFPVDATTAVLFKLLRQQHRGLQEPGPHRQDIKKIVNAFGAILDALSPVRNDASIAHPNEELLGEPEATLFINTVRTILHYLNSKLSGP